MTQKVFFRMAPPQILSSVMSVLCLLIDSIVIGRLLGVDAMSAYGLSSPLLIIFTAATLILACGVQVLSAKAVGRSDTEQARECFSTSVAFALLLAALTILAVFCAGDPICVLLGADVDAGVFALTKQYLRGYFLGAPFFLLGQLATPYLQVMGRRREIMGSVVVMTASDIIFDFLSVYVWDAGMFGIGLGSGLSYLLSLTVVAVFFAKRECIFRFSPKDVRRRMLVELLSTGSPVALVEVCYVLRVYLMNRILLSLSGAGAVAAYSVIAVPTDILYHIGLGGAVDRRSVFGQGVGGA